MKRTTAILVLLLSAILVVVGCSKDDNSVDKENSEKLDEVEQEELDLSEAEVQQMIHGMSHQKVRASEKWNSIQMTEERVDTLLEYVKEHDFEHKDLYIDILSRWQKGDFSRADKDHNAIWELQGGNIGRANGLLSKEEEAKFIEETFGKDAY